MNNALYDVLLTTDELESWKINVDAVAGTLDLVREAVECSSSDLGKRVGDVCWILEMFMNEMSDELMITANRKRQVTA